MHSVMVHVRCSWQRLIVPGRQWGSISVQFCRWPRFYCGRHSQWSPSLHVSCIAVPSLRLTPSHVRYDVMSGRRRTGISVPSLVSPVVWCDVRAPAYWDQRPVPRASGGMMWCQGAGALGSASRPSCVRWYLSIEWGWWVTVSALTLLVGSFNP